MSDRKAELERKKARLEQMREERRRKEEEKRRKEVDEAVKPAGKSADLRSETEEMLKEFGIPSESNNYASPVASAKPSPPASVSPELPKGEMSVPVSRKLVQLGVSKVTQTNIIPKETVSYSKETQTHAEIVDREDDDTDSLDVTVDTPPSHVTKMPQLDQSKPAQAGEEAAAPKEEEKPPPVIELTDDEKESLMKTEEFQRFFDRSTRIIERALDEGPDIFTDYSGIDADDQEGGVVEGEALKCNRQFFDEHWSKHRVITSLDWSAQYPELLVASYNNNEESPHEPDGVAMIWNVKYKKDSPEYVFHCQSAVVSACFAKFHPNLIVGGTYSGQIVLWDNRRPKRTPVQRTPLSASAHTHPVYSVSVVGTQNAHNLISVSTDGKMCSWSLDMLSQPQESIELQYKQTKPVAVTCLSFLSGDVNNFVVGSEEGTVYNSCRHGSKAGIQEMFEGHQGPITGLDCHNVPGQIDFSQYFVTSSFDWTAKLWNIKENKPVHSFEDNSDYVYDVRWSPVHPALFATVDGMGRLDLWNLNNDAEVPTTSTIVDSNVAVNKCRWHQTGQNIAVGDDLGRIHIYDVGEQLAHPKADEWGRFVHTLQGLQNQQPDADEDQTLGLAKPMR